MNYIAIHENAVRCARNLKTSERELINAIQDVVRERVWEKMGYTSLHMYAVLVLNLSDDQAYQYTRVAQKGMQVPVLQQAIDQGTVPLSNARRILTILTPDTAEEWVGKASTLSQRKLDQEIAIAHPKESVKERIKPLSQDVSELRMALPKDVEDMLRRIKDIESQKTRRPAQLIDALRQSCLAYLKQHDPLLKAKRNLGKTPPKASVSRQKSAAVTHEVRNRDLGQCAHVDTNGKRCPNRRWLDIHHIKPYSEGGSNTVENLITLCSQHHKRQHRAHDSAA